MASGRLLRQAGTPSRGLRSALHVPPHPRHTSPTQVPGTEASGGGLTRRCGGDYGSEPLIVFYFNWEVLEHREVISLLGRLSLAPSAPNNQIPPRWTWLPLTKGKCTDVQNPGLLCIQPWSIFSEKPDPQPSARTSPGLLNQRASATPSPTLLRGEGGGEAGCTANREPWDIANLRGLLRSRGNGVGEPLNKSQCFTQWPVLSGNWALSVDNQKYKTL